MQLTYLKDELRVLFLILTSVAFTACSLLPVDTNETDPVPKAVKPKDPTEREILFARAENYFEMGRYDDALEIYKVLTQEPPTGPDRIYESSLMDLADLYEKSDRSEMSILAIDELIKRNSTVVDRASLKVALIKNHYRVDNYFQAKKLRDELDQLYISQEVSLKDLFNALYYHTELQFDRHMLDELSFIGDMQKYFVYVMESNEVDDAAKLADLLKNMYERFSMQLDKPQLAKSLKKQLAISMLDQLTRFDRYKVSETEKSTPSLNRFSLFVEKQKQSLTTRLTHGNY